MAKLMKLQKHASPTGTQYRLGLPKALGDSMNWNNGDLFELTVTAKDTIQYKKVKNDKS